MRRLTTKRANDAGRGRFLLSVFAVAWLNLAIQPCLMAMEAAPEVINDSVHAAHMDHASHSLEHNCDHCPPALSDAATACASSIASDCSSIPDYSYDGRNGSPKLKDIPNFVAIADRVIQIESTIQTIAPPSADAAALLYPSEPPLNIRFCVFLK